MHPTPDEPSTEDEILGAERDLPADEASDKQPPADNERGDEAAENALVAFAKNSNYGKWLESTIFDFLDIADLPTSDARHRALVALKIDFSARFKIIEAYLFMESAYAESENSEITKEGISVCRAKMSILKRQIGI